MKFNRVTALAALLIATLCVGFGTAYAAPTQTASQAVVSTTSVGADGRSVNTVLDSGTFAVNGAAVDILDDAGAWVGSVPLRYSLAGAEFAIDPMITDNGRYLTLTPTTTPVAGALNLQNVDRNSAYTNMINQIEIGWVNGGATSAGVGAGIGAVVGCIFFLFVGCIPGAGIGGAIGAVTGINNANPAVTPAIFEFIGTP
ncbi:hypothetical protein [Rhodococcus sp. NPDC058521]|uniref:hypothetical protein n=1 Tax=Rhodococcus sp. NPDC058521 TaxID=3346536 RepID=UPI003664BBFD